MPRKSKSRTTTERRKGRRSPASRLLPTDRPPTHPGEMLLEEFLKPLGISHLTLRDEGSRQDRFAIRLRVSFPRLNEIIRGKRRVTADTALRLARVTGMGVEFWLGLQQDWHLQRSRKAAAIEALEPLPRVG